MSKKAFLVSAGLTALLFAGGIAARPRPGPETGPRGDLALRRFLQGMGLEVKRGDSPPALGRARPSSKGVYVLLKDLRDGPAARDVLRWVERGGRLILAQPGSAITEALGAKSGASLSLLPRTKTLRPGCAAFEEAQVGAIQISSADKVFGKIPRGATECFPARRGPFLLAVPRGRGTVFLLGGASPLTNQYLARPDNAVFAYRLAAGSGPVVFGPAAPRSTLQGPGGPWESLPSPAKAVLLQIIAAAVIFAFVNGRRFGRPVTEAPVSPIPAGRLVVATASLYRAAKAAGFAGGLLRAGARRRLAERLRLPGGADESVEATIADSRVVDPLVVSRLFDGPLPADDAELIRLGAGLQDLEEKVGANL